MSKQCPQCDKRSLHRSHRHRWQRMAAYLLPLRPYVCTECNYRTWRFLRRDESRYWRMGLGITLILLLGYGGVRLVRSLLPDAATDETTLSAAPQLTQSLSESSLAVVASAPPVPAPEPAVKKASVESPAPIVAAPAIPAPAPVVAKPEPAPPKAEPPKAAPETRPSPPPRPEPPPKVLRDISRQWDGQTLRVALVTDAAIRDAKVSGLKDGNRYTIDLPGSWRLGAGVPSGIAVPESRVELLRTEMRDGYLRVTLRLRDGAGAPPKIHATSDGLVIVLR